MTTLLESIFETIDTYIDNKLTKSNRHAAQPLFPHQNGDRRNLTTSDIVEMQKNLRSLTTTMCEHECALDRNEERLEGHNTELGQITSNIVEMQNDLRNLTKTLYAHMNSPELSEERLDGHNARISKTENGIRYLDERLDTQRLRLDEQLDNQRESVSES